MNWKTVGMMQAAKDAVSDEGAFTRDQILILRAMIELMEKAIDREASIASSSNHPSWP